MTSHIERRKFLATLGGAGAWPLLARAQQPTIGFLSSRSPEDSAHLIPAFAAGLAEGGYVEGQNLAIEFRWARGRYDLLPAMAAELVTRRVAVLTTAGGEPSALAANIDYPDRVRNRRRSGRARPGREFQSSRRQRDRGYPADKSHGAKAARAAARTRARRPAHRRFAQPEVCAPMPIATTVSTPQRLSRAQNRPTCQCCSR